MNYYIRNQETQKLEIHLNKEDYLELSEDLKKEIHSNFLFSRKKSAWVSRAKFPNLWQAETVAKKLGLADCGKEGEILSFEEQMNQKVVRAEKRAERYDQKSARATQRGSELQKPIHDMQEDIAFFTQPNISGSSGRAFTNRRNKMFAAWDKGLEEFKKSEYYAEKAERARKNVLMQLEALRFHRRISK